MNGKIYTEGVPHLGPGEWAWQVSDGVWVFRFGCPCGTQPVEKPVVPSGSEGERDDYMHWQTAGIRVYRTQEEKDSRPPGSQGWLWDGNIEAPTLTPSIQRHTVCKWHGYMTAGKFVSV